ncbi:MULTISPECIES: GNAT family N-acetyltransferase [unclassified Methanoregula]|uniref:GNAT family N-acetyltransferase n=1 Tax=unclassified Methanoregula TaxID=2649730 RepID=UPI0009D40EF4|nr:MULTISPECIES: GNAT family N-acetyltransferase [unclassified Methanoregula]OPX63043.1 MAG: putative acetyltransferase [Methanoregula sp. PtaB.Bin085]OPY32318.1 MAG: putative acetyltransferase [Methanoregula sp. PtaU1.Bin006]
MHVIEYRTTGFTEIDVIRPLWQQLNAHHHAKASRFRERYEQMTFEDRRSHFRRCLESGDLRIDLALDKETGRFIGYCVSSLSREKNGEIESLFVETGYRMQGIGTALVNRALGWMDGCGAERKRVAVGEGNEKSFAFYEKFGFFPRMTVLEQKKQA